MTRAGAGKNPNNGNDPGWEKAWNASLPPDTDALAAAVKCAGPNLTWTDSPGSNENRPMSCIDWYEAYAFCIWDGGRLPTEAEWNYAAAGGSEQRQYPWSNPAASTTIDPSYASFGCSELGGAACQNPDIVMVVGSTSPKGDGKWGQSELAGNVLEWTEDYYGGNTSMGVPTAYT